MTWRVTDKFRLSNTFTFDQFSIGGSNTLLELVRSTSSTGAPRADALTNSSAWRATAYRRFSNLFEGDYQVNRRFGFNLGYRFTNREVTLGGRDRNLISGAQSLSFDDDHENTTHSVIAGAFIKPLNNWTLWVDLERGESDNVFTRLSNNETFSFRARTRAAVSSQFTLSASAIVRNNDNPGVSVPILNSQGVVLFPATETIANTRQRMFTTNLDWNPDSRIGISAGYTYTHLTSDADIIVPVGTPIFPTTRFLLGRSEFYMRDSYFYFDVSARPIKQLTLYASYRLSDDRGQGDREITRPEDMIYSYPMRSHIPEIKLSWRITRNIDWNVGYQYYSYDERSWLNPFAVPVVVLFGDFDLTIFPERDLRFRLGYGFNRTEGPGANTLRFRSDEFQVDTQIKNKSDDLRAGVEGKLLGFNLGVLYGHRRFRDDTVFRVGSFNPGNNTGATTSFLTQASRDFNIVGTTNFVNFFF